MSHFSLGHRDDGEPSDWMLKLPRVRLPESVKNVSPKKLTAVAIVSLVAVVAFCYGLLQTSLFAVQRVDVNGLSHLQKADIVALSKIKTGESMVSINELKAANSIQTNPWVQSASVKSAWPHVVTINVVERTPIAQAQTANKQWATIGTNGVVLGTTALPQANLPALLDVIAPTQAGASLDASTAGLTDVAQLMPPSLAPHVKQLQNQAGSLKLGLDTGTVVVLGDDSDMANKLTAAASVVSHADAKKLAILDVRSPHLPVATPTDGLTTTTLAGSTNTTSKSSGSTTSTTTSKSKSKTSSTSTTVRKPSTTTTTLSKSAG